jgi:hypothetical protein
MQRIFAAFIVAIVVSAPAAAQPSISAAVGPGVMSVGGDAGASGTVSASGQFEHLFKDRNVRLIYEIDTGTFSTPGDWRFITHSAGGSYELKLGSAGKHSLYVGGDGVLRRNGDSWSAADFNAAGAFANLEFRPGRANVRTGYRLDVRQFPSSPAMDQIQHSGFGSVLVSFETRTTLIGEINFGSKHYEAVSSRTEVVAVPTEPTEPTTGMQGRGTGQRSGMAHMSLVPVVMPGSPGSGAQQVTVFARVAQSLASRTGLSVEVSRRRVSGQVSPALVATPAMFIDDGIYDDLFASDATRGGVTLKSIVGSGIELAGSLAWTDKRYGATYAFDEDGLVLPDVLRRDRVTTAQASATWPLFPSRTGGVALDLITGYDYTRHKSTSALYRYTAHAVRMMVGVTY